MSSFSKLRQTIENANALGRNNLEAQGVQVNGKETTYEIMKKIGNITGSGSPSIVKVQSDWEQTDLNESDYIKNKPFSIVSTEEIYGQDIIIEGDGTEVPSFMEFNEGETYDVHVEVTTSVTTYKYDFSDVKATNGQPIWRIDTPGIVIYPEDMSHELAGAVGLEATISSNLGFIVANNGTMSDYGPEVLEGNCIIMVLISDGSGDSSDEEILQTTFYVKKRSASTVVNEKYISLFQNDWQENDETAAEHIKNRPFYEDTIIGYLWEDVELPVSTETWVFWNLVPEFAEIEVGKQYAVDILVENLDTSEIEKFSFEDVKAYSRSLDTINVPYIAIGPEPLLENLGFSSTNSLDVSFVLMSQIDATDENHPIPLENGGSVCYGRINLQEEKFYTNRKITVSIKGEKKVWKFGEKTLDIFQGDFVEEDENSPSHIKNNPLALKNNSKILFRVPAETGDYYVETPPIYDQLKIGEKYTLRIISELKGEEVFHGVECFCMEGEDYKALFLIPQYFLDAGFGEYYKKLGIPTKANEHWYIMFSAEEDESEMSVVYYEGDEDINYIPVTVMLETEDYAPSIKYEWKPILNKDWEEKDPDSDAYIQNRPFYYYETAESYTPIVPSNEVALTLGSLDYELLEPPFEFLIGETYDIEILTKDTGGNYHTTLEVNSLDSFYQIEDALTLTEVSYDDNYMAIIGIDVDEDHNMIKGDKMALFSNPIVYEWRFLNHPGMRVDKKLLDTKYVANSKKITKKATHEEFPTALAVKNYIDEVLGGIENGSY